MSRITRLPLSRAFAIVIDSSAHPSTSPDDFAVLERHLALAAEKDVEVEARERLLDDVDQRRQLGSEPASALTALGGGANIYATTWADRAATRGVVLVVPAAALSEAWQRIRRYGPDHVDQMRDLLASPMVVVDPLDETAAADAGAWSTARPGPRRLRRAGGDLRGRPGLAGARRSTHPAEEHRPRAGGGDPARDPVKLPRWIRTRGRS